MNPHHETGRNGETLAREFLEQKGYTILYQNWRKGSYEIDLIALHKDLLIIAEVKTRSYSGVLEPQLAVNKAKQKSLFQAAQLFMTTTGRENELRFDVIAVVANKQESRIEHIEDAFRAFERR